MGRAVEMKNVSVVRNGIRILDSVNIDIDDDENVAIIGPNGSGKTTLMKLLSGEILPYYDNVFKFELFGRKRWDLFELRGKLGIVSMDLQSVFDGTAAVRNIIISGFFSSKDVYRNHAVTKKMEERAEDSAEIMGLLDKMNAPAGKISLGEMRRTLIARSLVNDPDMLVLDEPMTGLDIIMRSRFRAMFDSLIDRGTNIVMITHELEDIPTSIERIVMMKDGKIFADGPKDKMLTSEKMTELFGAPVNVECRNGTYHMRTD